MGSRGYIEIILRNSQVTRGLVCVGPRLGPDYAKTILAERRSYYITFKV